MELITHLTAPRGDIAGDPLEDLVRHLKDLEDFSERLGASSGLFLSDDSGRLYGALTESELKPVIKRISGRINEKIQECKNEISKQVK